MFITARDIDGQLVGFRTEDVERVRENTTDRSSTIFFRNKTRSHIVTQESVADLVASLNSAICYQSLTVNNP
jgi:hypothetical protein